MARRLTNDEFIQRLHNRFPDLEALEMYKGSQMKINVKCNRCGHLWLVSPHTLFHSIHGCPVCSRQRQLENNKTRLTISQLSQRLSCKFPNLSLKGSGVCSPRSEVTIYCSHCDSLFKNEFNRVYYSIYGCPFCGKDLLGPLNTPKFINVRLEQMGSAVRLVSGFVNMTTKCLFKCTKHGISFMQNPQKAVRSVSGGCPKCVRGRRSDLHRRSTKSIVNEINVKNPDCTLLSLPSATHAIVKVRCEKCGSVFCRIVEDLLHGRGCPRCKFTQQVLNESNTTENINERIHQICPSVSLAEPYVIPFLTKDKKRHTYWFKCSDCGYKWKAAVDNMLAKPHCPNCMHDRSLDSIGETCIMTFLDKYNVKYFHPYIPVSCKDTRSLHFDFKVGHYLIEYQGIQHFGPQRIGGRSMEEAKAVFEIQKKT